MSNPNARSGYAADIMPGIVNPDEARGMALPVAEKRVQPDPSKRAGIATYKVVDAKEAQENMKLRLAGKIPPIKGGIDDQMPAEVAQALRSAPVAQALPPAPAQPKRKRAASPAPKPKIDSETGEEYDPNAPEYKRGSRVNNKDNYDPLGGELEPGSPELADEERRLAPVVQDDPVKAGEAMPYLPAAQVVERHEPERRVVQVSRVNSMTDVYLSKRGRASMTLSDGTFTMPVIDVKECLMGVTIFLPLSQDQSTFIPRPGAELTLEYQGKSWKCYFPGTFFEIEELKLMGIVLVKADP